MIARFNSQLFHFLDVLYDAVVFVNSNRFAPIFDALLISLCHYKIVRRNQFAYSFMQTSRDKCIRIAFLQDDIPIVVSPAYSALKKEYDGIFEKYI